MKTSAAELSNDARPQLQLGYYLETLRLLCATGSGKPFDPAR